MPINPNQIIQITAKGRYLDQDIANVFHYRVESIDAGSADDTLFLQEWLALFVAQFSLLLVTDYSFVGASLDNLTDGISFADVGTSATGTLVGDPMPSSVCYAFKLSRSTKITRNGSKRFAGVSENNVSGNVHTFTGVVKDDLEAFLGSALVVDANPDGTVNDVVLSPIIIGRTLNADGVYELDLSKINLVNGAVMNPLVTTQNSRKP